MQINAKHDARFARAHSLSFQRRRVRILLSFHALSFSRKISPCMRTEYSYST
jgi:hypothetical protein